MHRWCLFSLNDWKGVATKLSGMGFLSGLVLRQCQHRLCPSTATSQWGCCCNIYHYCTDWFASDWWPFTILKFVKPTIFQRALLGGILTQKQGFTGEGVVTDHCTAQFLQNVTLKHSLLEFFKILSLLSSDNFFILSLQNISNLPILPHHGWNNIIIII